MMMLDRMEESGLTQKSLAERMGCSQQYVSRVDEMLNNRKYKLADDTPPFGGEKF